jgi:hypothetical protein
MRLPQKIVAQRDAQIYEARKMGMNYRQIADAFSISQSTAHTAYMRSLKRQAQMGQAEAVDSVWTHIDQLDQLIFSLTPMTRPHTVKTESGVEIEVPPDMDAINTLNKIMTSKAKIMGYEKDIIQLQMGGQTSTPGLGKGAKSSAELTSEQLAKELGAEMLKAGVLSGPIAKILEQAIVDSVRKEYDTIDGEVVEDSEDQLQLTTGFVAEKSDIPPPWVDDDDQEYIPGSWIPDDVESGEDYSH